MAQPLVRTARKDGGVDPAGMMKNPLRLLKSYFRTRELQQISRVVSRLIKNAQMQGG
jgi:hypothetical protein